VELLVARFALAIVAEPAAESCAAADCKTVQRPHCCNIVTKDSGMIIETVCASLLKRLFKVAFVRFNGNETLISRP